MLETEYKSLIDEETYKRIEQAYAWDCVKEQTNYYYFDESNELSKRKITVRIREKDGIFRLQVKFHKNSKNSLHISEEKEFYADGVPDAIEAEKVREITGVNTGRIVKSGSLTTLRHSLMWNETTEICLDKSTYFDRTDYEIETEYTNGVPEELFNELRELGVEFKERTAGKYSRFMKRLAELVNEPKTQ